VVVSGGIGNCVRGAVVPEGVFTRDDGTSLPPHAAVNSAQSRQHVMINKLRREPETLSKAKGILETPWCGELPGHYKGKAESSKAKV
jgi:hypothetical protein